MMQKNESYSRKNTPSILSRILSQPLVTLPVIYAFMIAGMFWLSQVNFLFFHTLIELIGAIISISVFILIWNAKTYIDNDTLLLLAVGMPVFSWLDILHALTYRGVNIFDISGANIPTQIWIVSRFLQAMSLLLAFSSDLWGQKISIRKHINLFLTAYILAGIAAIYLIFNTQLFPVCYIEGIGLTAFKIFSEYIITFMLAIVLLLLFLRRQNFDRLVFLYFSIMLLASISAELAFTTYVSVISFSSSLGHIFGFVSILAMYNAIIQTGTTQPQKLLFRNLKQVEEKLRESEQRYQRLTEMADEVIYRYQIKPEPRLEFISPASLSILGHAPEEYYADPELYSKLVLPEDLKKIVAQIASQTPSKPIITRATHPRGDTIWLENHIQTICDATGELEAIEGVARDITAQVEQNEILNNLSMAVQQSPSAILITDKNGSIEFVNQNFFKFTGRNQVELLGKSFKTLFPNHTNKEDIEENWRNILAGNDWQSEFNNFNSINGITYRIYVRITPIFSENGSVTHVLATFSDISQRDAIEKELRESQRKILTLMSNLPGMAYRCKNDVNWTMEFISDGCSALTGYSEKDLVGNTNITYNSLIDPEDRDMVFEVIHSALEEDLPFEITYRIHPADNSEKWVWESGRGVFDDEGRLLALEGFIEDVTEQKQADVMATQYHQELIEAYETTLEGWSNALELRERETAGHSKRVVEMTLRLARTLGLQDYELLHIRRGALLHDVGKLGIPDNILLKPGPLTDDEWIIMRQHPVYAYNLIQAIPYLRPATDIPYCHHEHWDGSGYPRGLKGQEIPLSARIFAVIDVWDALNSDRPYRPAWPPADVCKYIQDQAGKQFDPLVVNAFVKLLKCQ